VTLTPPEVSGSVVVPGGSAVVEVSGGTGQLVFVGASPVTGSAVTEPLLVTLCDTESSVAEPTGSVVPLVSLLVAVSVSGGSCLPGPQAPVPMPTNAAPRTTASTPRRRDDDPMIRR